ncbi:hypothetical protein PUN28_006685 [Cardiocondyla obscurior]|uniref:Transmembrane protein n=1 Tax=Cardiocondyla obscurior TaxID=286306 RepID=A0AAW2G4G1_9HYME
MKKNERAGKSWRPDRLLGRREKTCNDQRENEKKEKKKNKEKEKEKKRKKKKTRATHSTVLRTHTRTHVTCNRAKYGRLSFSNSPFSASTFRYSCMRACVCEPRARNAAFSLFLFLLSYLYVFLSLFLLFFLSLSFSLSRLCARAPKSQGGIVERAPSKSVAVSGEREGSRCRVSPRLLVSPRSSLRPLGSV